MPKKRLIHRLQHFLLLGIICFLSTAIAQTDAVTTAAMTMEKNNQCCAELNQIDQSLRENLDKQKQIQNNLKKTEDEERINELTTSLETLKAQEKSLESIFNKMAFGGINPSLLVNKSTNAVDFKWQEELLVIVKPLFAEMRSLTEKPREKDRLNNEHLELENKYKAISDGLQALKTIPEDQVTPEAKKRLDVLRQQWTSYQQELLNQKNIVDLQLKDLETTAVSLEERIKNALSAIFLGRGLILLMAVLAGTAVVLIFGVGMKRAYIRFEQKRNKQRKSRKVNTRLRFLWIVYNLIVYVSAVLAFLSVIYVQGDMVLFGLAVLLIFFGIISLRNSAPQYVSELKIFLNLGAVREGERIMYRGIPWEVKRLSFYCTCVNPLLENGRIRISLSEIAGLNSRPFNSEEEWFPTQVGDQIFLPDGSYGLVKRQTPEMVYLESFFREIMIPTATFYNMQVQNVCNGFYATPTFGLDYIHRDLPVAEVSAAFEEKIREKLNELGLTEYLRSLSIQVKRIIYGQAIEYTAILEFSMEAAGWYWRVERMVNHAGLEVCQEKGWQLPRQQISVDNHSSIQTGLDKG
ncbi:hypothetical protein [Wohlfahrtiimonas larvae]|uniref:Mechanosensitive ion channel n=1 Tax=Wohlfahrtiimonas larvae TaxID=1157986 RepID=A0ABP9MZN5_9GAMM|nr:hypothetical protein [Wohlfahrtiimonas larvae]